MVRLPWWLRQSRIHLQYGKLGFDPWVGEIPWRRAWQSTPVFLPGGSPWTEEPGGLQPVGLQRVRRAWVTARCSKVQESLTRIVPPDQGAESEGQGMRRHLWEGPPILRERWGRQRKHKGQQWGGWGDSDRDEVRKENGPWWVLGVWFWACWERSIGFGQKGDWTPLWWRMCVLFGTKLEGGSDERKTWKGAVWVVWADVMGVWPQNTRVEQGWIPLS